MFTLFHIISEFSDSFCLFAFVEKMMAGVNLLGIGRLVGEEMGSVLLYLYYICIKAEYFFN